MVSGSSCLFNNDRLFLRRLAYVESRDGTDPKTYRQGYDGGIWQVSTLSSPRLFPLLDILLLLKVSWSEGATFVVIAVVYAGADDAVLVLSIILSLSLFGRADSLMGAYEI